MSVREIPKAFEYTCDGCGQLHLQENASGHYSNSRPPRWASLVFARLAYDPQGAACADATVKLLLCEDCSARTAKAINSIQRYEVLQ